MTTSPQLPSSPEARAPERIPASFRDPCGFVFRRDGRLLRQINAVARQDYEHLINSGLYAALSEAGALIKHEPADIALRFTDTAYAVIEPETIPFVSYPYEWSFSQLKSAALLTLTVQRRALQFGMSLKDASAYNIQYLRGRPVFIDTLSFERYEEGKPWVAFRQFCQHFLAPLALMSRCDIRLGQLLRVHMDGVPLDLASALLPLSSWFSFSLLSYMHLHARVQRRFKARRVETQQRNVAKDAAFGFVDSLESGVRKLQWGTLPTDWGDYYDNTNYSLAAFNHKKEIVGEFLDSTGPMVVWDLGANVGIFSRIASGKQIDTISFDMDPLAVERNYLVCLAENTNNILPLLLDLTNPSPAIGWRNRETLSLLERGPADLILCLALIHHLAISNNVPMNDLARLLSSMGRFLIVEFVPKDDSQVQRLLQTRRDIFTEYDRKTFERVFSEYFVIHKSVEICDSQRTLYLMEVLKHIL